MEQHHERMDGRGYARGLKGDEIGLMGKVLAIVDTYDAITSDRSYKQAKSSYAPFSEMRTGCGIGYDIDLLDRFIKHIGIYTPGTIVQLTNGEYASVVENASSDLLRPTVLLHEKYPFRGDPKAIQSFNIVHLINSGLKIMKVVEPAESAYLKQKAISMSILTTTNLLSE